MRTETTRQLMLDAAERLFAEYGIAAVSSRQIAEAALQSNNSAVGYHFGSKNNLVLAIARCHEQAMDRRRRELVTIARGSANLYHHVGCLVLPFTDHLAELGNSSSYARFAAQLVTNPALHNQMLAEAASSSAVRSVIVALDALLPRVPLPVILTRGRMAYGALVYTCAEKEGVLARQADADAVRTWTSTGSVLIDAFAGLITAPVSDPHH